MEKQILDEQEVDLLTHSSMNGIELVTFAHHYREQRRIEFLEWVRNVYNPGLLLYAGSGFDKVPRRIFGESVVIHLSWEEDNRSYTNGYFAYLGSGMKVGANFLQTPLKNNSVEAVYIHDSPFEVTSFAVGEFNRVLKEKGILILDSGDWTMEQIHYFLDRSEQFFCDTTLASEFCDPNNTWREITDTQRNIMDIQYNLWKSGCGIIIGYSNTLARAQYLLSCILPYHRSIRAQCFAVLKKR